MHAATTFPPRVNYDESLAGAGYVPELLGNLPWSRRREQLLRLLAEHVFGQTPGQAVGVAGELAESGPWLGGQAVRRQYVLRLGGACEGLAIHLLLYLPAGAAHPVGVILSPNFFGNQSITSDPAVRVSPLPGPSPDASGAGTGEAARGRWSDHLPIERILAAGFAAGTFHCADVEEDSRSGWQRGVRSRLVGEGTGAWGAIAAWAWGCSRALDHLLTLAEIDAGRVAVMGHSRLGKTALWAGAQDARFGLVIANNSGAGGAKLARRHFGESVAHLTHVFPHWFCPRHHGYSFRESEMPVDMHMLLACVAPRRLCIASAADDRWADPRGEFLSAVLADPAWTVQDVEGLGSGEGGVGASEGGLGAGVVGWGGRVGSLGAGAGGAGAGEFPAAPARIGGRLQYHIRPGPHGVRPEDWTHFLHAAGKL